MKPSEHWRRRARSAEEAVSLVASGARVFVHGAAATHLDRASRRARRAAPGDERASALDVVSPSSRTTTPAARLARATGCVLLAMMLMIAGGKTASATGVITVRRATYGGNCGTSRDVARDDTEPIAAECNGKERCTYRIDRSKMSHRQDLKPHCAKSYVVVYACSEGKHHRVALQKPEANDHEIHLNCGD